MSESMKFVEFCKLLEDISLVKKEKRLKCISNFIQSARKDCNSVNSFFTIMRLLLPGPDIDTDRGNYNLKENTLGKKYIKILNIPKDSVNANKLLKFRSPAAGSSAGDFADVAFYVLRSYCRDGGKLTVAQIDSHLTNIATLNASNNPRGIDDELTDVLFNTSPLEQKWFIRLLLKKVKFGLNSSAILNAIHPDADDLLKVCSSLRKVCEKLQDPSKRLHEIDVELFAPCRPMLSERWDVLKVDTLFQKAPFYYLEKKHDGERFQIHIDHGKFCYFSKKGIDNTKNFGESVRSGTLTPFLAKQLNANVETCILDGEMMGWNTKLHCFGAKALKYDVKYLKVGDLHRPCFCAFDVLMLNGEVLTNKTVEERSKVLRKLFTPLEGVFMDTVQKCVTTSLEIIEALNNAIDNQEEGLILKNPSSIYKPASRLAGWFKIKPEYTVGLTDELDLIILGGYFGEGRRKTISHFLVGVAVPPTKEGTNPVEFHSIGRVGSGYSREELAELLQKLSPHWRPVKSGVMPNGLHWTKEKPDVWIEPSKSQILQVKATEIVQSDHYKTGYTLRFPRVELVRYDKNWSDCCTTTEFEKLRLSNSGKLASKHVMPSDLSQAPPTKRARTKVSRTVGRAYQAADLTDCEQRGSLFQGKEIYVCNGNKKMTKQVMEKRIHEQGGTTVQYKGSDNFCVVAGEVNYRVSNLMKSGDVNIVTVDWLLRVLDEERLVEWTPNDLMSMSVKTTEEMLYKYDRFHDSYTAPTTIAALEKSLNKVVEEGCAINLLPSEMADLDIELFSGLNKFAVFRCCVALFISSKLNEFTCELSKAMFQFYGGRRSEDLTHDVTHIIIDNNDGENLAKFQKLNQSRSRKFHIVSYQWIEACCKVRDRLGEFI